MENEIYGSDLEGEPESRYIILPLPQHPTTVVPGKAKVPVMIERAERGEFVFHPKDVGIGTATLPEIPGVPDPEPRCRWYGE